MITRNTCIALAALILGLSGLILFSACSLPNTEPEPKAAIIDQLCLLQPNDFFIQQATSELESYGFQVDVHSGEAITVDFYRKLPTYGYKVIIFRVHSGLLGGDPKIADTTWLFTNEPYGKARHTVDQLADRVTFARVRDDAPWFFAINSKFITEGLEGDFNNSIVMMMGCDCMHFPDLALSFIDRGASTCIGWHRSVTLDHVDTVMPLLLKKLCTWDMCVVEALRETMQENGPDPDLGAILKYYPEQSGRKTLAELIH